MPNEKTNYFSVNFIKNLCLTIKAKVKRKFRKPQLHLVYFDLESFN